MTTKRTASDRRSTRARDGLKPEYRFDYRKARPNRFASRCKRRGRLVLLDPDIARVFTTPESVNAVLRALLETLPPRQ